ncbi:MAG: response regulator [Caulobacter sp.]|nr:response regulator [Caulobacter sp.]
MGAASGASATPKAARPSSSPCPSPTWRRPLSADRTVHVIDDDEAMRDSLAFLLDIRGFETALYESADAFLAALPTLARGCILTDVRMPGLSGLELVGQLKERGIALPVIVMTGHGDVPMAVEAMKAGVVDFIEKPFEDDALLSAIERALASGPAAAAPSARRADAEHRLRELSPRERDVLSGVIEGKSNKVIALELSISPRTVEIYRANLMSKTGARNMAELMRIALAAGL